MTPHPTQRYRTEVTLVLHLDVEGTGESDAIERAVQLLRSRPGIRHEDIARVTAVPLTLLERMDRDNVCLWQEAEAVRVGTVNQRERWASGCLPEDEMCRLARHELYRPLALCPRRTRRGPSAIRHPTDASGTWVCADGSVNGIIPIVWSSRPDPDLTEVQWTTLRRVLDACEQIRRHAWMQLSPPTCVRVATRTHVGECDLCHQKTSDTSVLVYVDWAGRTFSREYSL